jgi:hypothetical protein
MRRLVNVLGVGFALCLGLLLPADRGAARADGLPEKQKEKKDEVKTKSVQGTLQKVDNNQIKVKAEGQEAVAAQINAQTKILVDGKEGSLTDLKAGQRVTCVYVTREGANVCLSVETAAAKK